jgi:non-heme Fe2+,alpha-ketoglutarate-dependent halogenase
LPGPGHDGFKFEPRCCYISAMPKLLTPDQIDHFRQQGYITPIRVMSAAAACECRRRLERFEAGTGGPLRGDLRHKSHLLFTWLADLVRHPRILDAVEDLYGPDLLCWTTNFFIKEKEHPAFVSWHQDSTYWGLSRPDVVTAWVALTPANAGNGAMEVIPGSHLFDQIPHRDTFARHNLLTRGQEVAVEVDASQAVRLTLEPGEMSLHHVRLIHGSPPNPSDDRRIGFAIRYIPTSVRQTEGEDSATLVRGEDRFGHFEPEPRPQADLQPEIVALHQRITERNAQILYRGTGVASYNDPRGAGLR